MLSTSERVVRKRPGIRLPLAPLLALARGVARRRPRTTAFVLALLTLAGTAAGLHCAALYQWRAAGEALKEGRAADACGRLNFCAFVWPRSVPVRLRAARAARLVGDFGEAEARLNECLKLQHGATEDVQLEFLLMRVQTGEADEVAPLLMTYVDQKHPETALILETLSRAYMHNLRYGPALVYLDRWIKEAPDAARPYHWRGWILERLNNPDGATDDYRRALELAPDLAEARLSLVEMLLDKSNPPEAAPHLEVLRKQCPDRADVMARLGQCRFLQGRPDEARPLLEAAVERLPNDPRLLITLAQLELQSQPPRPAEAEKWVRRLLAEEPYDVEAQFALYSSLQGQDRREEAGAAMERYKTLKALVIRANELLKDEAARPTHDPDAASEIGTAFLRIGQDRLGEYWLYEALNRDPAHQPAHKALAEYYEGKGNPEKAASHRRQLTAAAGKAAPR